MRKVSRRAATNPLPTAFCHGATLLPRPDGSVLGAWFGGTQEGLPDSGIYAPSHRRACYRGRVILGV